MRTNICTDVICAVGHELALFCVISGMELSTEDSMQKRAQWTCSTSNLMNHIANENPSEPSMISKQQASLTSMNSEMDVHTAPHSGESHQVRTQSLEVFPLKLGVGQYIAIHATLTASDFFLLFFPTLPVHSPAFFPKPLPIFPVFAVAKTWFLCRPVE